MKIEWNRVTWYSQIIALVLFVGVYFVGMYVGMQIEKRTLLTTEAAPLPTAVTAASATH